MNNNKVLGQVLAFLALLFLAPLVVKLCWNYVVTDWGLPYLTYWKAFAIIILVDFLFWLRGSGNIFK